jgi:hypothetical protein
VILSHKKVSASLARKPPEDPSRPLLAPAWVRKSIPWENETHPGHCQLNVCRRGMGAKNGSGPDPRQPEATSPDHANFMNETLGNAICAGAAWCTKSGYQFRLTVVCKLRVCKECVVVATPIDANTGTRSLCSTADGVIRYKVGPPMTAPVSVSECRARLPLQ